MQKWIGLIAVLFLTLIVGCGGSYTIPEGSDAVGYVYVDLAPASVQAGATLQVLPWVTIGPTLYKVVGATVTIVELDKTTTTSSDGSYGFFGIEAGDYTLRVSHPDYGTADFVLHVWPDSVTHGLDTHIQPRPPR